MRGATAIPTGAEATGPLHGLPRGWYAPGLRCPGQRGVFGIWAVSRVGGDRLFVHPAGWPRIRIFRFPASDSARVADMGPSQPSRRVLSAQRQRHRRLARHFAEAVEPQLGAVVRPLSPGRAKRTAVALDRGLRHGVVALRVDQQRIAPKHMAGRQCAVAAGRLHLLAVSGKGRGVWLLPGRAPDFALGDRRQSAMPSRSQGC